ncbi:hypothetical protein BD414DRAFT_129948 [Trametes punicea]|nr:hypothetical protein BD414DRAFT_129948 [Trametes punicea]
MVHRHSTVVEAYNVLELDQGASLEAVKSTYKQLALKTHPDKNPGDADATAQFQRLSEAYNVLLKHLDRESSPPHQHDHHHPHAYGHSHAHAHGGGYGYPFESYRYDEYDDYDDSEYDFYDDEYDDYDSEYEDHMDFYMFLFEELLRGHASRHAHARYRQTHRQYATPETPEHYAARLRKAREEQEQAAERRAQDEAHRKADQQRQRERERREAEERQRLKAFTKKAEAEASRKTAEQKARAQQEHLQSLRSKVFAAARRKDFATVKKGVYEENVDAAGGELRKGAEVFVKNPPADPKETLLQIAAKNGDLDLVQWLGSHGAEPEERNREDMTAFHVALRNRHAAVVLHFFETYPPDDEDYAAIYRTPPSKSNLGLALDTREPELVWMVLEKRLHSKEEMDQAWVALNTPAFKGRVSPQSKFDELVNLFTSFGDYAPLAPEPDTHSTPAEEPASPATGAQANGSRSQRQQRQHNGEQPHRPRPTVRVGDFRSSTASPMSEQPQTPSSASPVSSSGHGPRPYRGRGHRGRPFQPRPPHSQQQSSGPQHLSPRIEQSSADASQGTDDGASRQQQAQRQQGESSGYRGRGRGRGRGQYRGRGRGQAPAGGQLSPA